MIDGKKVIQKQLSISEKTTFVSDGRTLALTPARLTPVPDAGKLSPDGEWAVKRYPFEDEGALSESRDAIAVRRRTPHPPTLKPSSGGHAPLY